MSVDELSGGIKTGAKVFWFSARETMMKVHKQRKTEMTRKDKQGVDTYLFVEARVDEDGEPYLYFGWEAY